MMRPTSAGSRPPPASPRSISRFTARSRSRWFARRDIRRLAEWMQQLHPLRLQYELFSDANPMMAPVAAAGGAGAQEPQAGRRRQSVPRDAGERIPPDRRRARRVARYERDAGRADVPGGLRLAALQAAVGIDPADDASAAEGGKEPAASRAAAEADRRAQVAHSARRAARSRRPRRCSMPAWRGPRSTSAASRLVAPHSPGRMATCRCRSSRRSCASSSTCC